MPITGGEIFYQTDPAVIYMQAGAPGWYDFDGQAAIIYRIDSYLQQQDGTENNISLIVQGTGSGLPLSQLSAATTVSPGDVAKIMADHVSFKCPLRVPAGTTINWSVAGIAMCHFRKVG